MISALTGLLVLLGGGFMLVAAVGVLRMPDLFMRMHAATKAGTLGAGLLLTAVAVNFGSTGIAVRAIAAFVFLFLTAPIAAHVIGRAAYYSGELQLWTQTGLDDLAREQMIETEASRPETSD